MSSTDNPPPAQTVEVPSERAAAQPFVRVLIPLTELEAAFDGALPPDPDENPQQPPTSSAETPSATPADSTANPVKHEKKGPSWLSGLFAYLDGGKSKETLKSIRMLRAEYYAYFVRKDGEAKADSEARRNTPEAKAILRTRYLQGDAEGRRDMTGRNDPMADSGKYGNQVFAGSIGGALNALT